MNQTFMDLYKALFKEPFYTFLVNKLTNTWYIVKNIEKNRCDFYLISADCFSIIAYKIDSIEIEPDLKNENRSDIVLFPVVDVEIDKILKACLQTKSGEVQLIWPNDTNELYFNTRRIKKEEIKQIYIDPIKNIGYLEDYGYRAFCEFKNLHKMYVDLPLNDESYLDVEEINNKLNNLKKVNLEFEELIIDNISLPIFKGGSTPWKTIAKLFKNDGSCSFIETDTYVFCTSLSGDLHFLTIKCRNN